MDEEKTKRLRNDPEWTPFALAENIPELGENAIFLNSRYQVNVRALGLTEPFGRVVHLSIKRRDKAPIREWRELQRIKNEICGSDCEAVEIFPAEDRLVDTSNQYHLFVFETYRLPFGFRDRITSEVSVFGAVQEPFEWKPADCGARDAEIAAEHARIMARIAIRSALGIAKTGR